MRGARAAGIIVLALAAPWPAAAQEPNPIPPRPMLEPGADTNNAAAYYAKGVEWLARNPRRAADAFHWATLLEPGDAGSFYGRWVAGLLSQPRRIVGYFERAPSVLRATAVQSNDSLLHHAWALDPFFFRGLFEVLITGYIAELVRRENPRAMGAGLEAEIAQYLRNDADPYVKAMVAYTYRNFPRALDQLGLALRTSKSKSGLHSARALVYHHVGQLDSAVTELQAELDELRRRDTTDVVILYESKALLELSIGRLLEAQGDLEGAYQAYLRSAAEDLGFAPAHIHLAILALHRGDTTTAVSEVNLAADVQSDDPELLVRGGLLLIGAGHLRESIPHLLRARDLNPYYAAPHFLLARLHDVSAMPHAAVEHYQAFLAHARRDDSRVAMVTERVAALQADTGAVGARVNK